MTYNMTKVLIFADGSELNIDESSSITYITLTVNSFDEVQEVANKFTVENMKTLGIDTGVYTDVILETFMTRLQDDGSVFITILK